MGVLEKMEAVKLEMSRTQKNKATEYHLGLLKGKLAKYRAMLLEPEGKSGKGGDGFDVMKSGDARVALIGFPSVGKSTLLSLVTKTASETASYEFTTLTAIPGVIEYEGARIQLLDLPGIVEGASQGRGRGRQVVSVAKTADLILMMVDATKQTQQKALLELELEAVGIRLNKKRPDVTVKTKPAGGITINTTCKLTRIDDKMIRTILQSYKMHNCDVMIREDIDEDQLIDILIGNRKYVPCLYVYNKIDAIPLEEVDRLSREPLSLCISCELSLNLDGLLADIWSQLALVKIYTKKRGQPPDLTDPICMRKGSTIEHVCHAVHRSIADHFKYALCYGVSSRFNPTPQKVGLTHVVQDEDVVCIFTK